MLMKAREYEFFVEKIYLEKKQILESISFDARPKKLAAIFIKSKNGRKKIKSAKGLIVVVFTKVLHRIL